MTDISSMRRSFDKNQALTLADFADSPFTQFSTWFDLASHDTGVLEPNAFVLTTVGNAGQPRSRSVYLKYFDESGFVFFTNYGSEKAKQIAENNKVSMLFPWYSLERQMIIEGEASKVSQAESLKYFMTRPRGSQIGAWVSEQSSMIKSKSLLLEKVKEMAEHFAGKDVPLPKFWGGYRIKPQRFEFWQGQPSRLHDRIQYRYEESEKNWQVSLLSP